MNLILADFSEVVKTSLSIIVAILILLLMITVHEFGHYIIGKLFKFKIDEFAVGFGPKYFSKKTRGGEVFSLRLIPLGGYCAFAGESDEAVKDGDFNSKPPWQRILVLIAGATMNFLLAIVFAGLFLGIYGTPVYKIAEATEREAQVFMADDVLLSANGKSLYYTTADLEEFKRTVSVGDVVTFKVIRDGERKEVQATVFADENGNPFFDVMVGGTYERFPFFETLGRTFQYTFKLSLMVLSVFGKLITGSLGLSSMGGTVTTVVTAAEGIKNYGLPFFLQMTALIGVNLGVFNLMPIPALDGSKVIFTAIEWIRGKPINRKVEAVIHTIGLVLLLSFCIFVDLQHLF